MLYNFFKFLDLVLAKPESNEKADFKNTDLG